MSNTIPTAEELFETEFHIWKEEYPEMYAKSKQKVIEFAKLHVEAALKAASESRCINMLGQTWFAQSLEPGTKVLDRINIIVDKDSIFNSYPLDQIK